MILFLFITGRMNNELKLEAPAWYQIFFKKKKKKQKVKKEKLNSLSSAKEKVYPYNLEIVKAIMQNVPGEKETSTLSCSADFLT